MRRPVQAPGISRSRAFHCVRGSCPMPKIAPFACFHSFSNRILVQLKTRAKPQATNPPRPTLPPSLPPPLIMPGKEHGVPAGWRSCVYMFELMGPAMWDPCRGSVTWSVVGVVVVGGGLDSDDGGSWFSSMCSARLVTFADMWATPGSSAARHMAMPTLAAPCAENTDPGFRLCGSRAHRSCDDASAAAKPQLPRKAADMPLLPPPPPPPSKIGTPAAQLPMPRPMPLC